MSVDIFQTKVVFTPSTPARVAFVERGLVNDRLVNALTTPGKQIVVYGHSGSGKTTLVVNKLNQLYSSHITTRCMKGMRFEELILDGFDQLAGFYTSERSAAVKSTKTAELSSSYMSILGKMSASTTTEAGQKDIRILPPQLTPQALGRFIGAAGSCWLLEDFHKIDAGEKAKLSQLMKIFMDLGDDFVDLKIIALGAVDTARQVVDYDPEMRNRVAEIHVDLMTEQEIEAIIQKGEEKLNIVVPAEIKGLISKYSNGLASVCHHLCLYMCNVEGITHTCPRPVTLTKSSFERAIEMYVSEASDSIRSAFDKALKQRRKSAYDNQTLILKALSTFKERGASRVQLHQKITESVQKYPTNNLTYCLSKLITADYGEVVRFDSNSGLYSFSDPIYRAFALAHFRGMEGDEVIVKSDFAELMVQLTAELRKHFPKNSVRVSVPKGSK
jgi:hypothetical protein